MKRFILAIALSTFSLTSSAANLCGYISQEAEGTWLEVPVNACDALTLYSVWTLQGLNVEFLEQNQKVCVEFEIPSQGERNIQVQNFSAWDASKACSK